MKTTKQIIRIVRCCSLASMLAAAWLAAPTQVLGQDKGGQTLIQINRPQTSVQAEVSRAARMSCSDCKDVLIVRADTEFKGAGAKTLVAGGTPTQTVVSHLCSACVNTWEVVGHGKAKVSLAVHQCANCGAKTVAATGP